jgi:hypothetical protein
MFSDTMTIAQTITYIASCAFIYLAIGIAASCQLIERWRWYARASDYSTGAAWALWLAWPLPWLLWAVFRHYLHRPRESDWL